MKRKIIYFALSVLLAVCVNAGITYAQQRVLKCASLNPLDSAIGQHWVRLAEEFAKNTNNRYKINIYPSMQLGTLQEISQGVKFGTIDMCDNNWSQIAEFLPKVGAFDAPYAIADNDHLSKIVNPNHPLFQEINKELVEKVGIRVIGRAFYGWRDLIAKKPVYRPSDLKGVKIRAIPQPIFVAAIEGMGAIATPVDWAEMHTALATGLVSGLENAPSILYNQKFHTTLKYIMLTKHIIGCVPTYMNEKVFQSLSPDDQRTLLNTSWEVTRWSDKRNEEAEEGFIEKMRKEGATIIGPKEGLDIKAIKEGVIAKVMEKFKDNPDWIALYKRIREVP